MSTDDGSAELLPRRRADIWVRRDAGGAAHVLHDPASGVRSVVNETALAIWQLCDGHTRPQEMVHGVCELFAAPADVVAGDVHKVLGDLSAAGLLDWVRAAGEAEDAAPGDGGGQRLAARDRRP